MKIEFEWQMTERDRDEPKWIVPPPPTVRSKRRAPRWIIVLALVPVLGSLAFAGYVDWTYHAQLDRATREVTAVAKSEARAIAANDKQSFMALQDPDDEPWRMAQESRFGQLERVGMPEYGLKATGTTSRPGPVTLEPGGARLNMTYQFSVTQPMPNGPVSVTWQAPQFYKQTPSGWVHAELGADFWGSRHSTSGKRVLVLYSERDADIIEPLIPRLDGVLDRACASLNCPPQVTITFETALTSLWRGMSFSSSTANGLSFEFLSPYLAGLPADAPARGELYRAIEARVVQGLAFSNWPTLRPPWSSVVYQDSNWPALRPPWNSLAYRELVRWQLSNAGLAGPFITPQITNTLVSTLQSGMWRPLSNVVLESGSSGPGISPDEAMIALGFEFVAERLGADVIAELAPAMATSPTLGEAMRTALHVTPTTLEPDWQAYLRIEAGMSSAVASSAPRGELALECKTDRAGSMIMRVRADGTALTPLTERGQSAFYPAWSPDGNWLAFIQGDRVVVMDASSRRVRAAIPGGLYSVSHFGWLRNPPGAMPDQLWVDRSPDGGIHRINADTGQDVEITGANLAWSPDGQRVAFIEYSPDPTVWIALTDGSSSHPVALGYRLAWLPEPQGAVPSWHVAFTEYLDLRALNQSMGAATRFDVGGAASGTAASLGSVARPLLGDNDSIRWASSPAWSPDGAWLAVTVWGADSPMVVILDARTGEVRIEKRGATLTSHAWSADGHYVAFQPEPDSSFRSAVGIVDVWRDRQVSLLGNGWDWSPDGKWLAVTQNPSGVLVTTPDLAVSRRLDTPSCSNIAWRPAS